MITNLRYEWDELWIFFALSGMEYPIHFLAPTFSTVSLEICTFYGDFFAARAQSDIELSITGGLLEKLLAKTSMGDKGAARNIRPLVSDNGLSIPSKTPHALNTLLGLGKESAWMAIASSKTSTDYGIDPKYSMIWLVPFTSPRAIIWIPSTYSYISLMRLQAISIPVLPSFSIL